jgi:hypothetical protein
MKNPLSGYRIGSLLVLLPCLGLLAACGDEATDTGADFTTSTGSSFGQRISSNAAFVQAICDLNAPCCAEAGLPTETTNCVDLMGTLIGGVEDLDFDQVNACINAQRAAQEAAGGACMNQVPPPAECEPLRDLFGPTPDANSAPPDFSPPPNTGTRKPGEACENAQDCAPSDQGYVACVADFRSNEVVYFCQVQVQVKEGEPCVASAFSDDQGAYLSGNGAGGDGAESAAFCSSEDGLYCPMPVDGQPALCTRIGAVGDACDLDIACSIADEQYCNLETRVCDELPKAGEPCAGSCDRKSFCPSEGERVCQAKRPAGEPCVDYQECASGSCGGEGKCLSAEEVGTDLGLTLLCGGG